MRRRKGTSWVAVVLFLATAMSVSAEDWPTYRHDAARTGYTAEWLPNRFRLSWTYHAPAAPKPAWPTSERMRFDTVYQPILVGDQVLFGSSATDQIVAIDARTGAVTWSFCTDGPIRFAPVAWHDRVFVASDDGWLYALALRDGHLLWKHRGGCDDRTVIGNGRIISHWPMRGGPVVLDDTVYFAAGIWPSDGIFVGAVDAETGKTRWLNDSSGTVEMPQPHPGAVARSGIAPQGYLLADQQRLYVPTGRAVPAGFDRTDGRLLYYQLQPNQKRGGTAAALAGAYFWNSGCLFRRDNGLFSANVGLGPVAVVPGGIVLAEGESMAEYRWTRIEQRDRKGKLQTKQALENVRLVQANEEILAMIIAGIDVVCGADGSVFAIDYTRQQNRWWSHKVEGKALGLAYANGRLVVSTDRGIIYCFDGGADEAGNRIERKRGRTAERSTRALFSTRLRNEKQTPRSEPATAMVDATRWANAILEKTKVQCGYCVDWGCGDGTLTLELARRSRLHIYAVDPDAKNVAAARRKLMQAGLYGTRATVHCADLAKPRYPSMFANLIVSARSAQTPLTHEVKVQMQRMQRPYGGKMCIGPPAALQVMTRGPLDGAGNWTHQNAGPENTICSMDQRVHGPLEVFWFGDVVFRVPNRHGQGPAPLYRDGYLIVGGVNGVCCVDAFNGATRWTYSIPGLLKDFDGMHHDVGVGEAGSNLCLGTHSVYVRYGEHCVRLDLATGKKLAEYTTPPDPSGKNRAWGFLAYDNGILFGTLANEQHRVSARYRLMRLFTESVLFFALDPDTGRIKWTYRPQDSIRNNAIAIGERRVYLIDRPLAVADRITAPHRDGRQGPPLKPGEHPDGTIVSLDAATGAIRWKQRKDVFGTQLALSSKQHVLLMNYEAVRHNFFRLPSEIGGRMAAFDSRDGRRLWDRKAAYDTRPIICGDTIYAEGGAWKLLTGVAVPFNFQRSYGCGQIAAGARVLVFRSATIGYCDIGPNPKVRNFGGVRPGCWITAIPAGGMILAPNGAAHCTCSYQTHPWLALRPRE